MSIEGNPPLLGRTPALHIAILLALVLLIFSFLRTWEYGNFIASGVDFYQFWAVAQTVAESPSTKIYSKEAREQIGRTFYERAQVQTTSERQRVAANYRKVLETYSSPFLYMSFRLFSFKSYETSFRIYTLVCLICSVLSILALCTSFRYPFIASLLAVLVYLEWFEPLLSDIRVGNVSQLQLGMLALYLWMQGRTGRRRHLIGGMILGLGLMFKPNSIFVVVMLSIAWLINRRFLNLLEEYLGIGLAALGALVASSAYFGTAAIWLDWLDSLKNMPDRITTIQMGNCSFSRLIADVAGLELGPYIGAGLVTLAAIYLWRSSRKRQTADSTGVKDRALEFEEDALMVGIGCLIYLLAARLVWLHYLILVIPLVLFLLRPRSDPSRESGLPPTTIFLACLALLFIGINPLTVIFTGPFAPVTIACIGLFVTFTLGVGEIRKLSNAVAGPFHEVPGGFSSR